MNPEDLDRINELFRDLHANNQGIHNLEHGSRIGTMIVPGPDNQTPSAVVRTDYIPFPPTMVEAIKAALTERNQQITQVLTEMGWQL